jgi:hypothetical protein
VYTIVYQRPKRTHFLWLRFLFFPHQSIRSDFAHARVRVP